MSTGGAERVRRPAGEGPRARERGRGRTPGRGGILSLVALLCAPLAACAAGTSTTPADLSGSPVSAGTVTILAAASLTDVLDAIVTDLEHDHPGLEVRTSVAGSSAIVAQVNEGAPADVVLLAGEHALEPLEPHARRTEPVVIATNVLELAVPADNPGDVTGPADLSRPGLRLVVCQEQVPCGTATGQLFDRLGLTPAVASAEPDVRAVLTKVRLGEADVGIVYRTDVAAAGDAVQGIPLPPEDRVLTRYPALLVSDNPLGQLVLDELASQRGHGHLTAAGFGTP